MTTTISNLPSKLLEKILYRIPSKSMRAVRLTCKKWDTLTKSQNFSKMHFCKETALREGESQIIVMMDSNLYLKSFFADDEPYTEPKGKLTCQDEQVKISQVFNCEGLLLCIVEGDTKSKIVVWNPYWGQTRLIEHRYFQQGGYGFIDRYRYALGYVNKKDNTCRSHKILRFFDDNVGPRSNLCASEKRFVWYEIYDFDSDSWTTLDVPLDWFITFYQRGVSLKGKTYFCATKKKPEDELNVEEKERDDEDEEHEFEDEELDSHLICFDFTSESFGPLLPFPFRALVDDYVTLSCVREEKLAVLFTHNESNPYAVDIWITTKIEADKVSWSKFLTLNTDPDYPLTSHSGLFIDEEKKVAVGFDDGYDHHTLSIVGEAGYLRKLVVGKRVDYYSKNTHVCAYVPSLMQIKQPRRGKRKEQSSLEELRYTEKKLRLVQLSRPVEEQSA